MTFYTFSLGCKVNSYEIEALKARLLAKHYIEDKSHPDVVIINTCSVTATADQKSRQHIRKFKSLFPRAIIVVMGCYIQGNSEFVAKEIEADIIVGTSNRNKIPELIEEFINNKKQIMMVDNNPRLFSYEEMGITAYSDNARAYLKIQDGCNNFCSYCLIPYRRGKSRSRDFNNIIEEARGLVDKKYQEIVLTGIHVGGYGQDLNDCSFSKLVTALLDIQDLKRLRISSIEESEIDDALINLISNRKNLAHHFHIPLQSGSDTVLKRMNRKYNKEQFLNKIQEIKKVVPNVCLTTDVIVGFPGETDEEFNECFEFIKQCGFNMLHVFPFSAREGTLAYAMKNQVDSNIKKERVAKLINLSNQLWKQYCLSFDNQEVEVLVEQYDAKTKLGIGHTSNYLEVKLPCCKTDIGKILKTIYKYTDNIEEK